jgi:hypothetical protein
MTCYDTRILSSEVYRSRVLSLSKGVQGVITGVWLQSAIADY